MRQRLFTLLSIALLLLAWQCMAWHVGQPELVPDLPRLLASLCHILSTETFYRATGMTCLRAAGGLLLSLCAALITAWLMARSASVAALMRPWLAGMRSVPVISFILLALIFLHPEGIPLLIAFLTMFPILAENLRQAFSHLRPEYAAMARLFHLTPRNRWSQVIYPQIRPYLFSGLASAMGFGWRAIIMGEVLAQCSAGIGGEMKRAQTFIDIPQLLAWTGMAMLLGWLSDRLIRRAATWYPKVTYTLNNIYTLYNIGDTAESALPAPLRLLDAGYRFGVRHISFSLQPGGTYALVAPSGFGKTTCLRLIDGSYRPTTGRIENRPARIAATFQEPELLPHLSALRNVALPLASFLSEENALKTARQFLRMMEMDTEADQLPPALSYGQQQRVALARALAFPAPLLLMDEPFRGLDAALRRRIIRRIKSLQQQRRQTILFATHQPEEIEGMQAEVIRLDA